MKRLHLGENENAMDLLKILTPYCFNCYALHWAEDGSEATLFMEPSYATLEAVIKGPKNLFFENKIISTFQLSESEIIQDLIFILLSLHECEIFGLFSLFGNDLFQFSL